MTPMCCIMTQSHERILRRITRRFGNFPIKTYSNRNPSGVDVFDTYTEVSERNLKAKKTEKKQL